MKEAKEKQQDSAAPSAGDTLSTDQSGQHPEPSRASPPPKIPDAKKDATARPPLAPIAVASPASVPALAGGGPTQAAIAVVKKKPMTRIERAAHKAKVAACAAAVEKLINTDGRYHAWRGIQMADKDQLNKLLTHMLTMTFGDALDKCGLKWGQLAWARFHDKEFMEAFAEASKFREMILLMKTQDRLSKVGLGEIMVPQFYEGAVCGHRELHDIKAIEMLLHKYMPGEYNPVPSSSMSVSMRHGQDGEGRTLDEIVVAVENRVKNQVTDGSTEKKE